MKRFLGWLRGGSDEFGWDDLVARSSRALSKLAVYGDRGRLAFPPSATLNIEVPSEGVAVVQEFVSRPELDRAVRSAVANQCDCELDLLPECEYRVAVGERARVWAAPGAPGRWEVRIEGGDRDGSSVTIPRGAKEVLFGRGESHGAGLTNEIIVADASEFISRSAGRLRVEGRRLEVESLGQRDGLAVERAGGERIRPVRTARGWATLRSGDAIELSGGDGRSVKLHFSWSEISEGGDAGGGHP